LLLKSEEANIRILPPSSSAFGHLRPAAAPAIWPASVPAGMPVMHIDRPPRCARLKASAAVQILPPAPDRVARLFYLDAFVPTNGRALIDFLS
jgi:hypothetical protein